MKESLIDTDILSYYFKGNNTVFLNFENYLNHFDHINLSIISYYEIISGLTFKGANNQLALFKKFAEENSILPLTKKSARISSDLYAELRKKGKAIDDIDLLIAGIAMDNNLTLVTNNEKHFKNINGLSISNWTTE